MATEARRNGGRDIPLTSDEWRPKHKARRRPFGLRIHYVPRGFRLIRSETHWYTSVPSRERAKIAFSKNTFWKIDGFEEISR